MPYNVKWKTHVRITSKTIIGRHDEESARLLSSSYFTLQQTIVGIRGVDDLSADSTRKRICILFRQRFERFISKGMAFAKVIAACYYDGSAYRGVWLMVGSKQKLQNTCTVNN
jgi:hypothetical protein